MPDALASSRVCGAWADLKLAYLGFQQTRTTQQDVATSYLRLRFLRKRGELLKGVIGETPDFDTWLKEQQQQQQQGEGKGEEAA